MRKRIAVLGLATALLLGICTTAVVVHCQQLNTPPQAPVYPGSTLSRQWLDGIGSRSSVAVYSYTSPDAPEKIVAFYTEKGWCGLGAQGSGGELCDGTAVPFGKYVVGIDLESYASRGVTSYHVDIYWQGCSNDLF